MKKRILAFAMAAVLVVGSAMSAFAETASSEIDLTEGLEAYYTFDDTLENEITGDEATITTGAGFDWGTTSTSDEAVYASGVHGNAFSFAGNTAVDGVITDEVNSGDGLILDVQTADSFTISGWVCTSQKLNFQPVYFVASSTDDYVNVGTLFNNAWSAALAMINGWGGTQLWVDDNDGEVNGLEDIALDTWTYVTLTVTSNGVVAYYLDGDLVEECSFADEGGNYTGQYSGVDICLGINYWNASFAGLMDDITVYSCALSADEVAALYNEDGVPYSVTQTQSEIGLAVDDTRTISNYITTTPSTLATTVTYAVKQEGDYISIDAETGVITAHEKGTATITATYTAYGSTYVYTFTVTVSEPNSIESVSLGVESADLVVGGTMQLAANYTAEKNTTITDEYTTAFASDNTAVATVDATTGLVTAVGAGTANVTVTVTGTDHDGAAYTYTASVKITVTEPETVAVAELEPESETETETTTAATATNNDADPTETTTAKTSENTSDTFAWSYVILLAGAAAAVVVIARKKVTE